MQQQGPLLWTVVLI